MDTLTLIVPTLFGLESVVATELKRLGMQDVRSENGRVFCSACPYDIPRLNINLRCGERVLISLGSWQAEDFDTLFEGTKALPWEDFIPEDGAFPVKGYTLSSQLHAEPVCQSIIKKAIATRLGERYHRQTLPESGALYQVQFSLLKNKATLMIDSSGLALHKRGYRENKVLAPLRETLAAAMVLLSGYRGKDPLCDPHCGSGTIAIEAALIARNRAPGLCRSFSAQKWRWLPGEAWSLAAEEAMDREYNGDYIICGSDIDPHAVEIARQNAKQAEVDDIVRFHVADSAAFRREEAAGRIVSNPPYGERLLDLKETEALYRRFGQVTAGLGADWQIGVLSPHPDFEEVFGRSATKKRKLYNGKIKCNYYLFGK